MVAVFLGGNYQHAGMEQRCVQLLEPDGSESLGGVEIDNDNVGRVFLPFRQGFGRAVGGARERSARDAGDQGEQMLALDWVWLYDVHADVFTVRLLGHVSISLLVAGWVVSLIFCRALLKLAGGFVAFVPVGTQRVEDFPNLRIFQGG